MTVELAYTDHGSDVEGMPVVLLHAFPLSAAMFTGEAGVDWPETDRLAFNERAPEHLRTILPLTARILGHIHHRSVRRMTVQGMGLRDE